MLFISKEDSSIIIGSEGKWKPRPPESQRLPRETAVIDLHSPESSLVSLPGSASALTPPEAGTVTLMEDNGIPGMEHCFNMTPAFP